MPIEPPDKPDPRTPDIQSELSRLKRRRVKDSIFRGLTIAALAFAATFIVIFIFNLLGQGLPALRQAEIKTTVTYSEETVNNPAMAFPEDVRAFVSRAREREIPRQGKIVKLEVPVDLDAAAQGGPRDGLTDFTLELDDLPQNLVRFGIFKEPIDVPRSALLKFVAPAGLDQIEQAVEDGQTGTLDMWLWGSQKLSDFIQFGDALTGKPKTLAEQLEQAQRIEQTFNSLEFGDGLTREEWVLANSYVDQYLKGYNNLDPRTYDNPANARLTIAQADQLDQMLKDGDARLSFNSWFFLNGDSNQPEAAGVLPAVWGSVMVLTIVFVLSVPIGVLTSIYLEEFAPDNWLTQAVEVNINNLAAVPSILFGVLGLAALINFLGMPRSSAMVGGATLTLMTLPVVIISSRAALRAVPDSIRRAAYGMGATRWQVVTHHVLPLAIPGIMTGAIIGIAQAMGET
ncbi:MAG: DUF3333 domain-containing protein, partial [Planctomycetota bacterium]